MGRYIQQSDIEDVFGEANVLVWSNLDNDSETVNTTRIARAIAYAEEDIENRFRCGQYVIPFVGSAGSLPSVLTDWMAKLAGVWLYESRPQRVGSGDDENAEEINFSRMRRQVEKEINQYVSGQRRLALTLAESDNPTGPVVL